jgi:hypothetical protein
MFFKRKKVFSILLVITLVLSIFSPVSSIAVNAESSAASTTQSYAYSDGTVYSSPAAAGATKNIPGIIQAEEFNNGGMNVAYRVDTVGNQGNAGFRTNDSVDIFDEGDTRYIQASPSADHFEWVKYTVNVTTYGWYKAKFRGKSAGTDSCSIEVLFDDSFASYGELKPGSFADASADKPVYLTSGTHVMKVLLFMSPTAKPALDYISVENTDFTPTEPSVMKTTLSTDEVTIADIDVTQAPYNADNAGKSDCTEAIQNAIDNVYEMRGGTVFIPAGQYKLLGTLNIKAGVALIGDWKNPTVDPAGAAKGTILEAYTGKGSETGTPFILLSGNGAVLKNLSVWYPEQRAWSPIAFPYTIEVAGPGTTVNNITLYNSYNGINCYTPGSYDNDLGGIYATVMKVGLRKGGDINPGHVYNIKFDTTIWENAPANIITNKPTGGDVSLLRKYTSSHLYGMKLGEIDNMMAYNINMSNYFKGIYVKREYIGQCFAVSYGPMAKVNVPVEYDFFSDPSWPDMYNKNSDAIPETATLNYDFSKNEKSYNLDGGAENFYNVKKAPFNAVGNGVADDTEAIQKALAAAGENGGTVYLPQGQYKVTGRFTIPEGVELRGTYQSIHSWGDEACTLLAYDGKDTNDPDNAPAFITLGSNSGVRGFNIVYPEQGVNNSVNPIHKYPFTIRGTGENVRVVNVTPYNSYNFLDLNGADNHVVAGIRGDALNEGIVVRGGSYGGKLERICLTPYTSYFNSRSCFPTAYFRTLVYKVNNDPYMQYLYDNFKPYVFGDCKNETSFGTFTWWNNTGYTFMNDGHGCTDSTFWAICADDGKNLNFLLEGGNNNKLVGVMSIMNLTDYGGTGHWIKDTPTFAGKKLTIYGYMSKYETTYPTPQINNGYLVLNDLKEYPEKGYTTKYYGVKPDNSITRAELASMLVKALGESPVENPQLSFKDADIIPQWAAGSIAKLVNMKIISGYADGTFKPSNKVKRSEMAVIIIKALKLNVKNNAKTNFADNAYIPSWAMGYVAKAAELKIINGTLIEDKYYFRPSSNTTITEASILVDRIMKLQK